MSDATLRRRLRKPGKCETLEEWLERQRKMDAVKQSKNSWICSDGRLEWTGHKPIDPQADEEAFYSEPVIAEKETDYQPQSSYQEHSDDTGIVDDSLKEETEDLGNEYLPLFQQERLYVTFDCTSTR